MGQQRADFFTFPTSPSPDLWTHQPLDLRVESYESKKTAGPNTFELIAADGPQFFHRQLDRRLLTSFRFIRELISRCIELAQASGNWTALRIGVHIPCDMSSFPKYPQIMAPHYSEAAKNKNTVYNVPGLLWKSPPATLERTSDSPASYLISLVGTSLPRLPSKEES
ncbi:hypothetical protein Hypma_014600 [Hypsizygus marmoreus]|uniref:Uncharacterized protein n=1 Tax=Hypsizygus marmoreus TaxID=39966 RepID=A0A369JC44_HYPMA|nr:hypothetical protein Hypma_014600 [Hypsizygus marmoreus]